MDYTVHRITKSQTQLSDFYFPLENGMSTHSNILAWRIPGTEKPGGLESIGSQRAGYNWNNLAHTPIYWLCWVLVAAGGI